MERTLNQKFNYILCIAGTKTIYHEGISAAGASTDMLPYTAALDAEYLQTGKVTTIDKLPVSPAGIVSPVLVSRACLEISEASSTVIDAGAFIKPKVPSKELPVAAAESLETGHAMDLQTVESLFEAGQKIAEEHYASSSNYLVIGECVVAGTTTALGLLTALGFDLPNMVSSSLPNGNHELKAKLVQAGLAKALAREDFSFTKVKSNPLLAVSAMGDPMQAFVAGMAIAALRLGRQILLAGGSQMIAVAALIEQIISAQNIDTKPADYISVATSPWIVNDKSAQTAKLRELVCPNISVLSPNLGDYTNQVFKTYDQGHVKEGVGMGGLLTATLMQYGILPKVLADDGFSEEQNLSDAQEQIIKNLDQRIQNLYELERNLASSLSV